jgi:hypothetical protein
MVNPPVMLARPSRMASLKRGATMTFESSVAASWFCGSERFTILREMSAYSLAPVDLRVNWISTMLLIWPLGSAW